MFKINTCLSNSDKLHSYELHHLIGISERLLELNTKLELCGKIVLVINICLNEKLICFTRNALITSLEAIFCPTCHPVYICLAIFVGSQAWLKNNKMPDKCIVV